MRRLTDQEGQRLQQVVRWGSTGSVRYRRVMMVFASAGPSRTVLGFTGLEPEPGAAPPRWKQPVGPAGFRPEKAPPAEQEPAPDADAAAGRARRGRVEAARTALAEAQGEAPRKSGRTGLVRR
ncbi:hypothetical protein [Streptomyces nojiriensis]|uniref:hypothetical protein n=1 Tax=Streptomyces nojiriensis TaxID=66374 RepID=UPI00399B12C3